MTDTSPYPRWNYFGTDESDTIDPSEVTHRGTHKAEWVAQKILRRGATVLCPHCLENERHVPLSEPSECEPRTIHIEREHGKNITLTLAVIPKKHRSCPECGSITAGGPIADRKTSDFMELIDEISRSIGISGFSDRRLTQARTKAYRAKCRDDGKNDVDIVEEFIHEFVYQ